MSKTILIVPSKMVQHKPAKAGVWKDHKIKRTKRVVRLDLWNINTWSTA